MTENTADTEHFGKKKATNDSLTVLTSVSKKEKKKKRMERVQ